MPRTPAETRISRRLRFHDLQVFFAVVQCGSMAKAAAELGVTQPAVSEVIAGLEDAFGIRLFYEARREQSLRYIAVRLAAQARDRCI